MKQTLLQFADLEPSCCPHCGQHFSGDARFCPFDGEPLQRAPGWEPGRGDPLIGTVIDERYEVHAALGEGGMGTVYRARHVKLGRPFALKALRRDLSEDAELGFRFTQEAKAAAKVAHPNVVQISDFGTLPTGQPYFVMELLEGAALSKLIRQGPMSPARTLGIARQITEALGAAHRAGVVHRDLKPDNVLVLPLDGGDQVKVVDFGLARVMGTSRFTRAGIVYGTPHYMSPEQVAGESGDHRIDIYALGVILFEMLTGRQPFEGATFAGVLAKHIHEPPALPSKLLGVVGDLEGLEPILLRCLEKDADRRYASMEEVGEALAGASPAASLRPPSIRSFDPIDDEIVLPRRPLWPLVVAGAAVGVVLALVLIAWWSRPEFAAEAGASPAQAVPAATVPSARPPESAPRPSQAAPTPGKPTRSPPAASELPGKTPPVAAKPAATGRRKASGFEAVEIIDPWKNQ